MTNPPSPTNSDHLYTPLAHPAYYNFRDDLLVVPSPTLRILTQALACHADLLHMTFLNAGDALYFSDPSADNRCTAARVTAKASSNDLRFIEITDLRVVGGSFQVFATSANGMKAWHSFSRLDLDVYATLLGNHFSSLSAATVDRYMVLVRDAINPPCAIVIGVYYLKFTRVHLASPGSADLSRSQAEWDRVVHGLFQGNLNHRDFNTGYVGVTAPRNQNTFGAGVHRVNGVMYARWDVSNAFHLKLTPPLSAGASAGALLAPALPASRGSF
ncbi:hypothetical protein JCM11641_003304 [Rhodosporidiobolus odoratus]